MKLGARSNEKIGFMEMAGLVDLARNEKSEIGNRLENPDCWKRLLWLPVSPIGYILKSENRDRTRRGVNSGGRYWKFRAGRNRAER